MSFKKIFLAALIVGAACTSHAQYLSDALRFSQMPSSESSRLMGIGGNQSAIGGDISSIYGNPAGLGMFSKSEVAITPSMNFNSNAITFAGNNSNSDKSFLNLNNAGIVFHSLTTKSGDRTKGLLSLNFAIGYQKNASYTNDMLFSGTVNGNGLGDLFAENATAENASPTNLYYNTNYYAYYTQLIDEDPDHATDYLPNTNSQPDQIRRIDRSGGSSTLNFSAGANISNNLFLGASIGLTSLNYYANESSDESGYNYIYDFDYNATFTRHFDTKGSGVNFKLGFILRPEAAVRVAMSLESPTYYTIEDNYAETLTSNDQTGTVSSGTDQFPFKYKLHTPLKLNGGAAVFFGNKGFLSGNIEYLDYSSIMFSSSDSPTDYNMDMDIKQQLQDVINFSAGFEYKLSSNVQGRLGYHLTGNPYKDLSNKDYQINTYTAGLGYHVSRYYFDLAYQHADSKLNNRQYTLSGGNEPVAHIETAANLVALTMGLRF